MVEDTTLEVLVVAIGRLADGVTCRRARVSPSDFAYVKMHGRRSVDERTKTEAICIARRKSGSFNVAEISQVLSFQIDEI